MDDLERKYVKEVKDLLSSVELKILELLKKESKKTFMNEEIYYKCSECGSYEVIEGSKIDLKKTYKVKI